MFLVDPDPRAPQPTVPTEESICLDIHNNLKLFPSLCLWAVDQKLLQTHEILVRDTLAEFAYNELKEYVEGRSTLHNDFYKHLAINTQTRTFEDPNYVNTFGSKVVIRPLAETLELFVKKDKLLQRTMVHTTDPASASQDVSGDLSSGEIPDPPDAVASGDLPAGETLEDLPSGKRSRTEAKEEEDVEMQDREEQQQEEIPQDDPMEAPDYGAEEGEDSESESMNSTSMNRAN